MGGRNDEELSRALAPDFSSPYPLATLAVARAALAAAGLAVEQAAESFTPLRFYDVGAVVFFAKAIPWEFPGFSVQRAFGVLCALQRQLERAGSIQCTEHRYLLVAQKPVRRS